MKPFAQAHPPPPSQQNNNSVMYELQFDACGPQAASNFAGAVPMFLDRLQSGFLLFETQQGLVRVELSPRQRIYLLWTFRNFRQLSMPLLNSRQRALINALFRNNSGVVSRSHNPSLVIGLVESFVPPTVQIDASPVQKPVHEPAQKEDRQ